MRLLVVIGAGASYDCIPQSLGRGNIGLPLANELFDPGETQDYFLQKYDLMGLAAKLRNIKRKYTARYGEKFNLEDELAKLNNASLERNDLNTLASLFMARFYLQNVIIRLTDDVIQRTSSHTVYVELLNMLKDWIDESPSSRFIDIVIFNYDDLVERAMQNVYGHEWHQKQKLDVLGAYYYGHNLRIYKPHGSITWGRRITKSLLPYAYKKIADVSHGFHTLKISSHFEYIDPTLFFDEEKLKDSVPAIAIPFKEKTTFQECPKPMFHQMNEAIAQADELLTIGWQGADAHFIRLLAEKNTKIMMAHVVSPSGNTELLNNKTDGRILAITAYQMGFDEFTNSDRGLELFLARLAEK